MKPIWKSLYVSIDKTITAFKEINDDKYSDSKKETWRSYFLETRRLPEIEKKQRDSVTMMDKYKTIKTIGDLKLG